MRWYKRIFGGKKSMHGFWVSLLGCYSFAQLPAHARAENIYFFFGFLLVSFGLTGYYYNQEYIINNGKGK